eukprot:5854653-Pleurochrysis_carterae.AAC.1
MRTQSDVEARSRVGQLVLRGLARAHSGARQSSLRCARRAIMAGCSKTRRAREHGGRRRAAR